MKLYPLSLGVQEAPRDPFDPAGAQLYRIVAYEGMPGELPCPECQVVTLTGEHPSVADALGQLQRSIRDSMTRWEGGMIERDLHVIGNDLGLLDQRTVDLVDLARRAAGRREIDRPTWRSLDVLGPRPVANVVNGTGEAIAP